MKRLLTLSIMVLLATSSIYSGTAFFSFANSRTFPSAYSDFALQLLSSSDRITEQALNVLASGKNSPSAYVEVIQNTLIPLNIRRVLLDIGWQNYSIGTIPEEAWVNNWLSACDQMGIQNVLYVGQLTASGIGSPWIESLIRADPSAQTYYANGTTAPYVSLDDPDVSRALESDLSLLLSYYGSYQSWTGIGTGYTTDNPYYLNDSSMPNFGYSNSSIISFVNSAYFSRDTNSSGFDINGQVDPLWTSFANVSESVEVTSGIWMLSSPDPVYGNTTSNRHQVEMRFWIPGNNQTLRFSWYGQEVGNPGNLIATIYPDNYSSDPNIQPFAQATQSSGQYNSTLGWQTPVSVTASFQAGYYWIVFSSPTGNSNNYYNMYMRDYEVNQYTTEYVLPLGSGEELGGTILWITDGYGKNVQIYPYEDAMIPNKPQSFTASSTYSFNTVFLFLSDRDYGDVNATLYVQDTTTGAMVAAGVLSQRLTHGLQNWTPIQLNQTVTTAPGQTYLMTIVEPNAGYSWSTVLRGLNVYPSVAGFQNQSSFWLFRLALMNWTSGYTSFDEITANGGSPVSSRFMDAVRFQPSTDESLESISILTKDLSANNSGNYSSSDNLVVSLESSAAAGSKPSGQMLQQKIVNGSSIPKNGWVSVSGFNTKVISGEYYWIVFSTTTANTSITFARMTNAYAYYVLVSPNNGSTWAAADDGPTEFSFSVTLSSETIGNFVNDIPIIDLSAPEYFAQPFTLRTATQISGVYLGMIGRANNIPLSSYLSISINPDNGRGEPSQQVLASGKFYGANSTFTSPDYVQFNSVARVSANSTYWIVIKSINATYSVDPVEYTTEPAGLPLNSSALISYNGGYTWSKFDNQTSELSYKLVSPARAVPTFNTSQIFSLLATDHDYPTQNGTLKGWNGYIQNAEAQTYASVASWLQNYTGRTWLFYASVPSNVVNQTGLDNVIVTPSSPTISDCANLEQYLLSISPLASEQYVNVANFSLLQHCTQNVSSLAQQLNYASFDGGYYGSSTAASVLIVGNNVSKNLIGLISSSFNVTYVNVASSEQFGNVTQLARYQFILWLYGAENATFNFQEALVTYVVNGGNLIVFQKPPAWMTNITGTNYSVPYNNGNASASDDSIINTFTNHTEYFSKMITESVANKETIISKGDGITIAINQLGAGKVTTLELQNSTSNSSELSDENLILSNIIARSLGLSSGSPLWPSRNNGSSSGGIELGVLGEPSGRLLIWLANTNTQPANISVSLDGEYFGLTNNSWLISPDGFMGTSLSGSVVNISKTLSASSWTFIYVVPNINSSDILYTNAQISKQLFYPNQGLVFLNGYNNQSVISVFSVHYNVGAVILDSDENLTKQESTSNLSIAQQGWYYDNKNGLLYVKYLAAGNDNVRVLETGTVPDNLPTEIEYFSLLATAVLAIGEAVILIRGRFLRANYRPFRRSDPRTEYVPLAKMISQSLKLGRIKE